MNYSKTEKEALHQVALASIKHGLENGEPLVPSPNEYAPALQEFRATFVTLMKDQSLRGCIGSLLATQPLVADTAKNAFQAAFHDPRFSALEKKELPQLTIKISILSPPEDLDVKSEEELLTILRPFKDGIILQEGHHRGTFLPSVWKSLPNPKDFIRHLKEKAGLPKTWPEGLRVQRYTTVEF